MIKRTMQNVTASVAIGLLVCAAGGCGTAQGPEASALAALDQVSQATQVLAQAGAEEAEPFGATAEDSGMSSDPGDEDSWPSSDASVTQADASYEAEDLAAELQELAGDLNEGTDASRLDAVFSLLSDVTNSPAESGLQLVRWIQTLQELRTEIRRLRHTMTRAQAAELLLNALAAAETTDGESVDVLSQLQNLLSALRLVSTETTATTNGTAGE